MSHIVIFVWNTMISIAVLTWMLQMFLWSDGASMGCKDGYFAVPFPGKTAWVCVAGYKLSEAPQPR